jgi:DNA-binding response OmpR family regulator
VGLSGFEAGEFLDYRAFFQKMDYQADMIAPGNVSARGAQALVFAANTPASRGASELRRDAQTRSTALVAVTSVELGREWACRKGLVDHFVTPADLPATVNAVSQVLHGRGLRDPALKTLSSGPLSLDLKQRLARAGGSTIPLSPGEFNLLALLVETSPVTQDWERLRKELRPVPEPCSPRESLSILRRDFVSLRKRLGKAGNSLDMSSAGLRLVGAAK